MRDAGELCTRKRCSNLGTGIRGGIDLYNAQSDGSRLLIDGDIPAAVRGGEGYAVAPGDIAYRGFGFDQVICRIGQKCRLCATVVVHLNGADACTTRTLKDIEGRAAELVGVISGGDGGVRRLFLE